MKETFLTARWNTVISLVLGLLIAAFVIAVLAGDKAPFALGERTNFTILAVLGIFICVKGNSHSALMFGWTNSRYWLNPISIVGMGLGVLALLLVIISLAKIGIPFISGKMTAFLVLAVIIFIKIALKILQNRILDIGT